MKTLLRTALTFIFLAFTVSAFAQKKTQKISISRVIPASAEKVWAVVGEDFGAIAYSHPQIVSSDYINGSLESGEGAERVCNFNDKGTKYLHEKQVNFDPKNFTFKVQISHASGLPMNPAYSYGTYKVERIDENSCRFVFESIYRTKPAFMGSLAKGKFTKILNDYAIAIEHHVLTGEKVNKENFKEIKKKYKS